MDTEEIKQLAMDINNCMAVAIRPYQEKIKELEDENTKLKILMGLAFQELQATCYEKMPDVAKRLVMDAMSRLKA